MKHWGCCIATAGLLALSGCAPAPVQEPTSVADLASRAAEKSLLAGIRAYDDGDYAAAENALRAALADRLSYPRDVATAWKYLAFVHCISNRPGECEAAFREAFAAEPGFDLNAKERGHPLWGPVFQAVKASLKRN
jgi:Tfp pilus assembly protein PilF